MDNKKALEEIQKSVEKSVTNITQLGDSVLVAQQFDSFVREMQEEANILGAARFQRMDSPKMNIDRIAFLDRVLEKGVEGTESDKTAPTTSTNTLLANELMAIAPITDQALRRNIERGNLEDTIVQLLGEAAGRDMEEYGIFASTDFDSTLYNDEGWSPIDMTDGWIKKAGNKLYNSAFDDTADNYPENLFQSMLNALPKKYLRNRADWRFYVPFAIEDAYRDLLKARGTNLGDAIQVGNDAVYYKGIPVVYSPMLERYNATTAMLQNPDNMVWGIFHEVTLEAEREAKLRQTDFVLTFEGDAGYEDENAVVTAQDIDETDDAESTDPGVAGAHPLAG